MSKIFTLWDKKLSIWSNIFWKYSVLDDGGLYITPIASECLFDWMFIHTLSTCEPVKSVISLYVKPYLIYTSTPPPCLFLFFLTQLYPSMLISWSAILWLIKVSQTPIMSKLHSLKIISISSILLSKPLILRQPILKPCFCANNLHNPE